MNQIRAIQALNKTEIENGISPEASWHTDYHDTAYIYFGGLPYNLSEGDVITIFSQFGEPVFLRLARDKETGKSKGFGWLKYEDQRSTDLAVDNIGGAEIGGRLVAVDHTRYKLRDDEDPADFKVGWEDIMKREGKNLSEDESSEEEERRPMLPEERELAILQRDHDDDDPMKSYLIEEKKKEIDEARRKAEKKDKKHKHRHHRSHRSRRDNDDEGGRSRSRRDDTPVEEDRRHRDRGARSHRDRDDSRERDVRRAKDAPRIKREGEEDTSRDGRRDREGGEHRRHDRGATDESRPRRHRDHDGGDRRRRQRSRSRSSRGNKE
ncbi:hypothetical protein G7046_g8948 [Stylonectria norvegica]|nr:hypothetical protein G7046_g8948 [Stylonectria norvegica]